MVRSIHSFETYVRRIVDNELDVLIGELPAILLDGPKGVGKTATAARRAATVRRLDERSEAEVVSADASIIGGDPSPVLIDEWHRVPSVWDAVRRLVDEDPPRRAIPAHRLCSACGHPLRCGTNQHNAAAAVESLRAATSVARCIHRRPAGWRWSEGRTGSQRNDS